MGADLGNRIEGDAPDVRAGVRENRREVRNPALASVPPALEATEAQEEQRLLLETEDGQDPLVDLASEREDLRRATSGPRSSLTINQDVSNLVLAPVPPSITLSIIRPSSLSLPGHRSSGSRAGRRHLKVHADAVREHSYRTQPRINA
jgi:hypothetical protein